MEEKLISCPSTQKSKVSLLNRLFFDKLTFILWSLDKALKGRKPLRVLIVLNTGMLATPSQLAAKFIIENLKRKKG